MPDPRAALAGERSAAEGAGLAFAIALLLTLVMAAPVVVAPRERIFGNGEILSVSDPNLDARVVIDQFETGQVPAPYLQPFTDLPGRFLAMAVGPVAAYNLVVLVTFPLASAAAFLLAFHIFHSRVAGLVAGLVYAFLPFHVMQAGGHPHVAQTQWIPLYLLALWKMVERPGLRAAAWLAAATMAVALSNFYGGFIVAVLTPTFLVAILCFDFQSRWRGAAVAALLLTGLAAAAAGVVLAYAPAVLSAPSTFAFPRSDLFIWSARWWSYLVPPADHPIWGRAVRDFWTSRGVGADPLEHQQVGLGLSFVVLACVPLIARFRGGRISPLTREVPGLIVIALASVLCSLSPERSFGEWTFERPAAILYDVAPMFRAYARFGVVTGLMTALLAGAGAALLLQQRGGAGRSVAILLLGLGVIEFAPLPPWRYREVAPTMTSAVRDRERYCVLLPKVVPDIPLGTEWIVDAHGCDPAALRSSVTLARLFSRVTEELGLHPTAEAVWHVFPGQGGITGVLLLSESHLSCHTFPEHAFAALNLYSCRPAQEWPWAERLREAIGAHRTIVRAVPRGEIPVQV